MSEQLYTLVCDRCTDEEVIMVFGHGTITRRDLQSFHDSFGQYEHVCGFCLKELKTLEAMESKAVQA